MVKATIAAAALLFLLVFPAAGQAENLFNALPSGSEFAQFPFWKQVLADEAAAEAASGAALPVGDRADTPHGCTDERRCAPAEWTAFLADLQAKPRLEQIAAVNRWVNQRPYVEDIANWGVADYWETPGEFLARGGDCEDYAITKYFSLIRLGVSSDDLRLAVVKDKAQGVFHAVLEVRAGDEIWLLDNQIAHVVPLSSAPQYQMIYGLNDKGWWMDTPPRIDLGAITIVAAGPSRPR